jgi:hypothetical protein
MGMHNMLRIALALTYFTIIPQMRQRISQSQLTDDETWVSFVNFETKQQSNHWMHIKGEANNYPHCSCICVYVGSTVFVQHYYAWFPYYFCTSLFLLG